MNTKVMRYMLKEYYGIPGTESTVTFHYVNPGFVKLNETGGAQTESESYIGDKNATTTVTGYENAWDFETQYISGEPVCEDLYEIGVMQKVGGDCERQLVSIDLMKPAGDTADGKTFKARMFKISVEATPPSGEPRKVTKMSGKFHQLGDMTTGVFDIGSLTFTADE